MATGLKRNKISLKWVLIHAAYFGCRTMSKKIILSMRSNPLLIGIIANNWNDGTFLFWCNSIYGSLDVAIFKMETWWVASKTAYQLPNARQIMLQMNIFLSFNVKCPIFQFFAETSSPYWIIYTTFGSSDTYHAHVFNQYWPKRHLWKIISSSVIMNHDHNMMYRYPTQR